MGGYFRNWSDFEIIKFLELRGFIHTTTHGDDRIYVNRSLNASVKVTTPQKSTPIGTMLNIVRNSKISKSQWLNFRDNNFKA
jgi:predicted RNA binding protein YcfA (HicA-like mRNA interferase family)